MRRYQCSGCVYRYPEPDDVNRVNALASTVDAMRVWQIKQILPKLVGLPIHVNHQIKAKLYDVNTGALIAPQYQQAVTGVRPLGYVTTAWLDAKNGLHWSGELEFGPDDTELMQMYLCGLLPECSLHHTVSSPYQAHTITPVEISICHKGYRQGTTIYTGGDTATYMRNTGFVAIKAMENPTDLMVQCASRLAVLEQQVLDHGVTIQTQQHVISGKDAEILEIKASRSKEIADLNARIEENVSRENAVMAARMLMYDQLCGQVIPGHPGSMPITIMANSSSSTVEQSRKYGEQIDAAIVQLRATANKRQRVEEAVTKFDTVIARTAASAVAPVATHRVSVPYEVGQLKDMMGHRDHTVRISDPTVRKRE